MRDAHLLLQVFHPILLYDVSYLVYNGNNFVAHQYLLTFTFTGKDVDYVCNQIDKINKTIKVIDEDGEDVAMRFTDFDELRRIYYCK